MNYTLTQGPASNYEIALTLDAADMKKFKNQTLRQFQKEMEKPGFRKGHVPLPEVEKSVQPMYLMAGVHEQAIHAGMMQVVKENEQISFIWNVYDLKLGGMEENSDDADNSSEEKKKKDDSDETTMTFKIDIYPETKITNKNRESATIAKIEAEPTQEEIDDALMRIRRQFADYKPADAVWEGSIFKASFVTVDAADAQIDTGSVFLWKEDIAEFPILKTLFWEKKEWEEVVFDYDADTLPPMFHVKDAEQSKNAVSIKATIWEIKTMELLEMSDENIVKMFGNEEVDTVEKFMASITENIKQSKKEQLLVQSVETYLKEIDDSFELILPKTLIDEEVASRYNSLKERMWGEEGLEKYYTQIWEEEKAKLDTDIRESAKTSMYKFFVLQSAVKELDLNITNEERQQPLAVEQKLYEHFNG